MSSSTPPTQLCGVRITQGGPVIFIDPLGQAVSPGERVLIAVDGREEVAIVAFAPEQFVERPPELGAAGRILRRATADDSRAWGRRQAVAHHVVAEASAVIAEGGLTAVVEDAWLQPGGGRWVIVCVGAVGDGVALGRLLARRLGLPVELIECDDDAAIIVSGTIAAGLPEDWPQLPTPGEEPAVHVRDAATTHPAARAFIDRLFLPQSRPTPRHRR
jgi:antitoxin (DNA-binding transcriptional repressor) of toxin-antitoxin stability system